MSNLLAGKLGVVMGVANDRSIAWGIAKNCKNHGADVILTYQGETLSQRVKALADQISAKAIYECDVSNLESIDCMFDAIRKQFGKIDFFAHSVAFADKNELRRRYIDTSKSNFLIALDISCYSFVYASKKASELMPDGGSIVTLSYYGAEKVVPNYNVMGVAKAALESSVRYMAADLGVNKIRVNAISAGPIKTLASFGIGDFNSMLHVSKSISPLKENVSIDDVGGAAVYLISNLSTMITGEVLHVDAGYNVVGCNTDISNK